MYGDNIRGLPGGSVLNGGQATFKSSNPMDYFPGGLGSGSLVAGLATGGLDIFSTMLANSQAHENAQEAMAWEAGQADKAMAFTEKMANNANAFTEKMQQRSEVFNAGQAKNAMDFSREMASTQYQRQVNDLRAAGINPMLAAGAGGNAAPSGVSASVGGGQGASGSGQMARAITPQVRSLMEGAVNDALSSMSLENKLLNDETVRALQDSERYINLERQSNEQIVGEKLKAEIELIDAEAQATRANSYGVRKFNEWQEQNNMGGFWYGLQKMLDLVPSIPSYRGKTIVNKSYNIRK